MSRGRDRPAVQIRVSAPMIKAATRALIAWSDNARWFDKGAAEVLRAGLAAGGFLKSPKKRKRAVGKRP
jgi:hypothetical protein